MRRVFLWRALAPTVAQAGLGVTMLLFLLSALPISAMSAAAGPDSAGPDNTLFTQVLHDYVREGVVNYQSLKDDKRFAKYIALLMKADPNTISRQNRLTFWINVYNAFVLKIVCDQYPIKSIMSEAAYALGQSNFQEKLVTINGMKYSLNDVENDIIRPLGDPRIHFAINCAAKSCPPLRSEAFAPARLSAQLDEQARQFINNPEKNSFDFAKNEIIISKIFEWFEEDFKKYDAGVPAFISRYLPPEQGKQLLAIAKTVKIKYHEYNWDLNE